MSRINIIRAFTLIEVTLYLALFAVLMSSLLVSAYPLMRMNERQSAYILRENEVLFITEKVRNTLAILMTNPSVTITEPSEDTTGPVLRIAEGGAELLSLEEDDSSALCTPPRLCSMLLWSERGSTPLPLNNARIDIDNFLVTHTGPTHETPRTLEISFTAGGVPVGPVIYTLHF